MLVAFAYEFPHRKTRDGLLRLVSQGIKVGVVIAAPWKNLGPKHAGIVPSDKVGFIPKTEIVCSEFGIDDISAAHESDENLYPQEEGFLEKVRGQL